MCLCCLLLCNEFRISEFSFNYHDPMVFYECQWRLPHSVYLAIRFCLFLYTGFGLVYFAVDHSDVMMKYFTVWSYIVLMCHLGLAAVISLLHYSSSVDPPSSPPPEAISSDSNYNNPCNTDHRFQATHGTKPATDKSQPVLLLGVWTTTTHTTTTDATTSITTNPSHRHLHRQLQGMGIESQSTQKGQGHNNRGYELRDMTSSSLNLTGSIPTSESTMTKMDRRQAESRSHNSKNNHDTNVLPQANVNNITTTTTANNTTTVNDRYKSTTTNDRYNTTTTNNNTITTNINSNNPIQNDHKSCLSRKSTVTFTVEEPQQSCKHEGSDSSTSTMVSANQEPPVPLTKRVRFSSMMHMEASEAVVSRWITNPNVACHLYPESDPSDDARIPFYMKLSWVLATVASVCAPVVTAMYFTAVYPDSGASGVIVFNDLNIHILNSVFVAVDHALSARPVRVLQVYVSVIFGGLYVLFSVVFWSQDPSNNVVYGFLDWNYPGSSAGICVGLVFLFILIQLGFYGIFVLKLCLAYTSIHRSSLLVPKAEQ